MSSLFDGRVKSPGLNRRPMLHLHEDPVSSGRRKPIRKLDGIGESDRPCSSASAISILSIAIRAALLAVPIGEHQRSHGRGALGMRVREDRAIGLHERRMSRHPEVGLHVRRRLP